MNKFVNWLLFFAILLVGALTIFPGFARAVMRFFLALLMMVGLYACANAEAAEVTVMESYEYGRFTVEVMSDGSQVVVGGIFEPPETSPIAPRAKHFILVNFRTKELHYRHQGIPIIGYSVVTPDYRDLPMPVVRGKVKAIELNPWWCPTPNGRKKYPDLPPGCLPPGHEMNNMGVAKFIIDWEVSKALKDDWETIRLHGTSGYSPGPFWEDDTLGCARLTNAEMLKLIEALGHEAVREGIEVVFFSGLSTTLLAP